MKYTLIHMKKPYITSSLAGIVVGVVLFLFDHFHGSHLLGLSSFQTFYGFWIITNILIILSSTSHFMAGTCSFLYMFTAICVYLAHGHVYLLPLLIDMGGSIIFMPIFWKRVNNKLLYLISTILLAILLYLIFYASSF